MFKRKLIPLVLVGSMLLALASPVFAQSRSAQDTQYFSQNLVKVAEQATTSTKLPPGVTLDPKINPVAPVTADYQTKFAAILKVAESKLGTPYRWGHNEDRGQFGFDCSNFTSYVYHHALGYKMTTSSQKQYRNVGWVVPKDQMRPGDLVVFNKGGHVAIYIGNNRVIQEGGGLGKVGYLSVAPGSYWYKHITVVKRMF
ncbi:MAG: C40 family peptidase [Heliobacteriaceae bacterium]|nr:C40 family peptidase [Heliobacteriaceae bacterium]MDD4587254.1 C40 family peptidase [Heliobacteriaceae bacterium]